MSVVTYDQSENPLVAASKKIKEDFVADPVSEEALVSMAAAAFRHGEACKSVIFAPNWQQTNGSGENFPSGFQFVVDKNSQVVPALFPPQMCSVQMAFPLKAGFSSARLLTGDEIDGHHFTKNSEKIASNLHRFMPEEKFSASGLPHFAGIFSSEKRTASGFEPTFFAVALYSDPNVAGKIQEKIRGAKSLDQEASAEFIYKLSQRGFKNDPTYVGMASPHVTWQELFVNDHEMISLREQQTQACANVLLTTIRASGLGSVAPSKDGLDNMKALLNSSELIKSVTNDVDHLTAGGDLAFLSELSSVHSAANGHVFRETAQLGITLYGPSSSSELPKASDGTPLIGMPCSAGQVRSVYAHNNHKELGSASNLSMRGPFVWDSSGGKIYNTFLSPTLFRQSSANEWKSAATKIGFTLQTRDVQHLKPVIVKMATTPQPTMNK